MSTSLSDVTPLRVLSRGAVVPISTSNSPALGGRNGRPDTPNAAGGEREFDPETVARDLKKEGSDWITMFNPNVKRVLDVGLVHTLVHDS